MKNNKLETYEKVAVGGFCLVILGWLAFWSFVIWLAFKLVMYIVN